MLSQLAQATFFNINVFTADHWGSYSVTVILGLFFIFTFCLLHFWLGVNLHREQSFLALIAIFCMPFLLAFFWQASKTLKSDLASLKQSSDQVLVKTFCQMDQAQKIGGIYCILSQYLADIRQNLPAQSKLALSFYPGILAYGHYFLYPDFQLVSDPSQADYLVTFLPEQAVNLSDSGDLLIGRPGSETNYGLWQALKSYNPKIIIFQRL